MSTTKEVRTTVTITDARVIRFIDRVKSDYPKLKDAHLLNIVISHGIDKLEAMSVHELQACLLKG